MARRSSPVSGVCPQSAAPRSPRQNTIPSLLKRDLYGFTCVMLFRPASPYRRTQAWKYLKKSVEEDIAALAARTNKISAAIYFLMALVDCGNPACFQIVIFG